MKSKQSPGENKAYGHGQKKYCAGLICVKIFTYTATNFRCRVKGYYLTLWATTKIVLGEFSPNNFYKS